jgi:hypothetical protein
MSLYHVNTDQQRVRKYFESQPSFEFSEIDIQIFILIENLLELKETKVVEYVYFQKTDSFLKKDLEVVFDQAGEGFTIQQGFDLIDGLWFSMNSK